MTTQTTMPVQGMTGTGCESNIRFALTPLEGVCRVDADREAKSVEVDYDPALITVDEVPRAVKVGYRVVGS